MSRTLVTKPHPRPRRALTSRHSASQTFVMAHTYLLFDLGSDEEKVQQARHKLESWKQAFRLDKKLQYKLEREQAPSSEPPSKSAAAADSEPEPAKSAKSKPAKGKSKPKSK